MKLYVADGTASYQLFSKEIEVNKLSDYYYIMDGDFSDIPYKKNCTTIGFNDPNSVGS